MDGKCVDVVTTDKAKLSNNSLFIRRTMFKVQPLYTATFVSACCYRCVLKHCCCIPYRIYSSMRTHL